jgi:hypothetical protein
LGPLCGRSGPHTGGLDPILGVRSVHVWVLDQLGGPDYISRGPALSHGGPDSLLMPWSVSLSLATWRPQSHPRGGGQALLLAQSSRPRLGRVMVWSHVQLLYHATKDSHVGTASSYSSKGYPSFRVLTVAPRPTSGEDVSLQVGPKLVLRLNMARLVIGTPFQCVC